MPDGIRRARAEEAPALSELAERSKRYWGYDETFMARVRESMTLTADDVERDEVWVLETEAGDLLGFHRVIPGEPAVLEDLWVEPDAIGRGAGRMLFEHARQVARDASASALELDADPNAIGFYERMGMAEVGVTRSGLIPGRTLPRMRLEL